METILVRHAQSEYNAGLTKFLDSDISEQGMIQAKAVSQYILERFPNIKEFTGFVSPYRRCLQTARVISQHTGLSFHVTPGPREIMTKYDTFMLENHKEHFPEFTWGHDERLVFLNETDEQFIDRIKSFHDSVNHIDKKIIVSHGTPINTFYELSCQIPPTADTVKYVRNCSVSYIRDGVGELFDHVSWV